MDFSYTHEQMDLQNLVKNISANYTNADDGKVFNPFWKILVDTGILGSSLPKKYGGTNLSFLESCIVAENLGLKAVISPFIVTTSSAIAIEQFISSSRKLKILSDIVRGRSIVTLALNEENIINPFICKTKITKKNKLFVLNGSKVCVPYAKESDYLLVSCLMNSKIEVVLIDTSSPNIEFKEQATSTGEPQYIVNFKNLKIDQDFVLRCDENNGLEILERIINKTVTLFCSYSIGLNESMLDLITSYTTTREAFKTPIASFQAVSHRAANCYIDIACLRAVTQQAISSLCKKKESSQSVAIAKVWCGDVCHRTSYSAQHLHGGIGIDREYPLFRFCLMAKQLELTLGSSQFYLTEIGNKISQ